MSSPGCLHRAHPRAGPGTPEPHAEPLGAMRTRVRLRARAGRCNQRMLPRAQAGDEHRRPPAGASTEVQPRTPQVRTCKHASISQHGSAGMPAGCPLFSSTTAKFSHLTSEKSWTGRLCPCSRWRAADAPQSLAPVWRPPGVVVCTPPPLEIAAAARESCSWRAFRCPCAISRGVSPCPPCA
jgi:hypothetical protein